MFLHLCSRIEVIHCDDVLKILGDEVILQEGKSFIDCKLESASTYQGAKQPNSAGVILNETINAKMKYGKDSFFLKFPLEYFIVRVHTSEGIFIVGSLDYPAVMTLTTDKTYINLTFKASSPA